MRLMDKIKMATNDLLNRKLRTFLTIIAVSIGSLLLVVMMGLGDGIVNTVNKMLGSFGDTNVINVMPVDVKKSTESGLNFSANMNESTSKITEVSEDKALEKVDTFKKISTDTVKDINNMQGVDKLYTLITTEANSIKLEGNNYVDTEVSIGGVNLDYYHFYKDSIEVGSDISNEEDLLIGETLAKKLNKDDINSLIGKVIVIKIEYPTIDGESIKEPLEVSFKVAGILDKKDYGKQVIMSDKKASLIAGYYSNTKNYLEEKGYNGIKVYTKDGYDLGEMTSRISSESGYQCFSMAIINKSINMIGTVVKSILSIAGIIVLVVAALGLVNTMTMTLQEKKKMIGVMRSVGGSRSNIRSVFIFQSFILGILGAFVGIILSIITIVFINEVIAKDSGFSIALTLNNISITTLITLIIALIAGFIPSSRAARLNIVEAVAEE